MSDLDNGQQFDDAPLSENYQQAPFGVDVLFPETVTIRMVDASALGDYEFSVIVSGFCCNAAVGFLVAALTITEGKFTLGCVSCLFFVLTLMFGFWAVSKRTALKRKAKTVKVTGGRVGQ